MNAGSARESFTPIGSNLPGYDNYFCRDCRHIVHVRQGLPDLPAGSLIEAKRFVLSLGRFGKALGPKELVGEMADEAEELGRMYLRAARPSRLTRMERSAQ